MSTEYNTHFEIRFETGQVAQAVYVQETAAPEIITQVFNLNRSQPAIFITGGASAMSDEDIQRTQDIINMLAQFAQDHDAVIVDGGTDSGIMQMMGAARKAHQLNFKLIGVCPLSKVAYPGYENPDKEANLDPNHSHFVLIDGDSWGDESALILSLTRKISENGKFPRVGILINGGNVARQEVYLAATSEFKLPMMILEGSGRAADEIASAFKTGRANQRILQAILAGGDIQLVNTIEGADVMRNKLEARFKR